MNGSNSRTHEIQLNAVRNNFNILLNAEERRNEEKTNENGRRERERGSGGEKEAQMEKERGAESKERREIISQCDIHTP